LCSSADVFSAGQEKLSPGFVIVKGQSPSKMAKAAVLAIGGMGKFVHRGDVVLVKPNIGWDRLPEQAANTNPEVVAAVVEMAFDAGAKKVVVMDNTCNDPRRCYVRSGIEAAAKKVGGEVRFVEERMMKEMDIGGDKIKKWPVNSEIMEADVRINIPIAKHHGLTRLTLSMKNWYGAVGGRRNELHQDAARCVADLAKFFAPQLTILDAYRILKANGPQGGNLADVEQKNILAVSRDQVAIDSFGASLFSIEGKDLPFIVAAEKLGVGTSEYRKLNPLSIEV
jgi:uncharacterized protein (DUF362 family)